MRNNRPDAQSIIRQFEKSLFGDNQSPSRSLIRETLFSEDLDMDGLDAYNFLLNVEEGLGIHYGLDRVSDYIDFAHDGLKFRTVGALVDHTLSLLSDAALHNARSVGSIPTPGDLHVGRINFDHYFPEKECGPASGGGPKRIPNKHADSVGLFEYTL